MRPILMVHDTVCNHTLYSRNTFQIICQLAAIIFDSSLGCQAVDRMPNFLEKRIRWHCGREEHERRTALRIFAASRRKIKS